MPADTGFPRADVENDFQRARRRQVLARLSQRLRREPDDVNLILPFDEVVAALGMTGERKLGLQVIKLDTVVGTVDSTRDFDRRFRPTSSRVRERWERLALAQRRGESIPPIDVYRVGELHFVVDGHHRVSIALAMGQKTIDAYVTEILRRYRPGASGAAGTCSTRAMSGCSGRGSSSRPRPTPRSRSPIPGATRNSVRPWRPGGSALMQHEHKFYDRAEVSRRWFSEEFTPVVRLLHAADLVGSGTDADAYLTITRERYRLIPPTSGTTRSSRNSSGSSGPPAGVSAAQEPWRCPDKHGDGPRARSGGNREARTGADAAGDQDGGAAAD